MTPAKAMAEWQARSRKNEADQALKRDLDELGRLANSIAQHGLINPISVAACRATRQYRRT